jgi:hypothetical protein
MIFKIDTPMNRKILKRIVAKIIKATIKILYKIVVKNNNLQKGKEIHGKE